MSLPRAVGQLSLLIVGAALIVAGIVVYAVEGSSSFGWFAYEPLGDSAADSYPLVLLPGHLWGLGMSFVGSVLLSGLVGYWLGQRRLPAKDQD